MPKHDYWKEAVASSFEEHDIKATVEQIAAVAGDIQVSHENIGLAFPAPEGNPLEDEIKDLKRKLNEEYEKVICPHCKGKGVEISFGPVHSAVSQCNRCYGRGRVHPRNL
jgi:hypothetical protein